MGAGKMFTVTYRENGIVKSKQMFSDNLSNIITKVGDQLLSIVPKGSRPRKTYK